MAGARFRRLIGGLTAQELQVGKGFQLAVRHEWCPGERQQQRDHGLYGPHGLLLAMKTANVQFKLHGCMESPLSIPLHIT